MPKRRWTVVFLPPRNEPSRAYELPEWTLRAIGWGAAIGIILVAAATTVLFTPWGTPGSRLVAAENEALRHEIEVAETRFRQIDDTLRVIAARAEQLRMIAGMPADTQRGQVVPVGPKQASLLPAPFGQSLVAEGVGLADRRRPFLGRLGWGSRPDIEGLIARATELSNDFRNVSDTLELNFKRFASTPSIMPTTGWLSSQFTRSRFHPILHENRPHKGIDVTAPVGTPIVAPATGRVAFAGTDKGFGLTVEIDHGNGIRTRFAHCSRLAVKAGQQVTRGQLIAAVGSTGLSTAPHLHYEIHVDGQPVDPLKYVLPEAARQ
jgi:murein DD-endopeptidase MepM/ murein hydrolase activator NlpD